MCEFCINGLVVFVDQVGDGVCDDDEIFGCTNPLYEEFNPLATEDLYYLAMPSGKHYFSKTFAEHKQAKKRYLKRKAK